LFFDEVNILLPGYMYGRHHLADPSTAIPLEERGLLRVLEPADWVTGDVAMKLTEVMVDLLTTGAFDDLPDRPHFEELSQSRIGYGADVELAEMLVEELEERGLARPSEDGVSIPLHPDVRKTILVILGQLARLATHGQDLELHPATQHGAAVGDLLRFLSNESMPSANGVVTLDLEPVAFDLDPVPLDEVLEFRDEFGLAHRTYMRDLRRFMAEISSVEVGSERERVLLDRRQELADHARELQKASRSALATDLASWSLGIAGSVWSGTTGDPIGVALGAAGAIAPQLLGAAFPANGVVGAYSYLFEAHRRFGR